MKAIVTSILRANLRFIGIFTNQQTGFAVASISAKDLFETQAMKDAHIDYAKDRLVSRYEKKSLIALIGALMNPPVI
ncbi:hypothetical protein N7456_006759 [Penicillium angulare]|uniref:Uncharacterized protein n=1 Tax=Penicillium angulare TaxID=116970 RepID=A0A9W9FIC2_9EURO|nr:hypothetical protein N7456_006759 [Penicillium angulare]